MKITKKQLHQDALRLLEVTALIKALTTESDVLKKMFKATGSVAFKDVAIVVSTANRNAISSTLVKERYPAIAVECTQASEVVSVSAKKI